MARQARGEGDRPVPGPVASLRAGVRPENAAVWGRLVFGEVVLSRSRAREKWVSPILSFGYHGTTGG